ncbi:MAG: UDP-N-acetylmuramyl pentapeptide synthase [Ignavibacteria bacterium]|nr:MAG: UDP-N-acetylmuramyl pentapeptide synthase [Ignavibacteria bacterium]KAF0161250.1 MAG: UDP-N-acetylmuramyl pentapeptide synthase [Ignavibacteria bacterium]
MGKLKITLEDLFNLPTAVIYNPDGFKPISKVEIDSRSVKKGSLFAAIKGEKFDGHDFVLTAVKNGANAVVVNKKKIKNLTSLDITVIAVEDTAKAYGDLANVWRKKLKAKVVAITGSNGKTSTKEMAADLLSEKFNVVKTLANNNNHIGVPLTIFSTYEKCEILVLEQGTNHFGEIPYSAKISQPDFAMITNIGDSHIEFLINREGVYKEKSALFDEAEKNGGTVLINTDDIIIRAKTKGYSRKITYGFYGNPDVKGKVLGFTEDGKTKVQIITTKETFDVTLPVYGEANAKNFLAAAAVALNLGLSKKQIVNATKKFSAVQGRLEVKQYKNAVVINDTYNASPASVIEAVKTLHKIKTYKKKIVVLGDIFELGSQSVKMHKELEKIFKPSKNLVVLTVGSIMQHLVKELRKKKIRSIHFFLREALSLYLQYEEIENSVILVKGSRGMKMEEFVNILDKRFA